MSWGKCIRVTKLIAVISFFIFIKSFFSPGAVIAEVAPSPEIFESPKNLVDQISEWYVSNNGSDENDCSSPTTPCASVNAVFKKVGFSDGDIIKVASGTYTGSDPEVHVVTIDNDVTIIGGWNEDFTLQEGDTIFDGEATRGGIWIGYAKEVTIDTFIIQNSNRPGLGGRGRTTIKNCEIRNNVMMNGGGGGVSVDAYGLFSMINCDIHSNTSFAHGGGMIINGQSSGDILIQDSRIYNNETLNVIPGNARGGGIYIPTYYSVTISNSEIYGNSTNSNGGGIYIFNQLSGSYSQVTINNSSIYDNISYDNGGGIYGYSIFLNINNSSIYDNISTGEGGGINVNSGTLKINNSTISGNQALENGGGFNFYHAVLPVEVNNSTIANNFGNGYVFNSTYSEVHLKNSIIANNFGSDCVGRTTSEGFNLIGNKAGCTIEANIGDQFNVNPLLIPLANYGGFSPTHALLGVSPAVDAGDPATPGTENACFSEDQRKVSRPYDGDGDGDAICDIGAFELSGPASDATYIFEFGGSNQTAWVNNPFSFPFKAIVVDHAGVGVPGVSVKFSAPDSGPSGTFLDSSNFQTTVVTDALGIAQAPEFVANNEIGDYQILISTPGLSEEIQITVGNRNHFPAVYIQNPTHNQYFTAGDEVNFIGIATDVEDGDISSHLLWESSIDGLLGSGENFTFSGLSIGQHLISASVTDSHGKTMESTIFIWVQSHPPEVLITSPMDGDVFYYGHAIQFTGIASDVEDGDISDQIVWQSSLDKVIGNGDSFITTTLSGGVHEITASVTDSDKRIGSGKIIIVIDGGPATIENYSGSPQKAFLYSDYEEPFKVIVKDENGSPLEGIEVTFTAPSQNASGFFVGTESSSFSASTDAYGIATTSEFRANTIKGNYAVIASVENMPLSTQIDLENVDLLGFPYEIIAGNYTFVVGNGDFNADGLNDVALTTQTENLDYRLNIFTQRSDGILGQPELYLTGTQPNSIAVGDLNNDGLDDIAVGFLSDNQVGVYLQNSNGTLESYITYETNQAPYSAKVGDLNNDGLQDLVVSHQDVATIGVFLQQLDGTLGAMIEYPALQPGWDEIDVGDINSDNLTDVIKMNAENFDYPNISVYLQNQFGILEQDIQYSLDLNCLSRGLAVGDVTGDGRDDVVLTFCGLAIFPQNEFGTLDDPIIYGTYDSPKSVEIGDLNQDGRNDLVLTHWRAGISVYLQKDDGTLTPYIRYYKYTFNNQLQGLSLGDITGDNQTDVIMAADDKLIVWEHLFSPHNVQDTEILGGSSQQAPIDVSYSEPLTLRVTDEFGAPVQGARIVYSAPSSGASVTFTDSGSNISIARTNEDGLATSATLIANSVKGAFSVQVNVQGVPSTVQFSLENISRIPTVNILTPIDGSIYSYGNSVDFSANASDLVDGNLTANLSWVSSFDGELAVGGAFSKSNLSVGVHVITASVTNSSGFVGSNQVMIVINEINTSPIVTISLPANGDIYNEGDEIIFTATALDDQDGDLSSHLNWASDLDGAIGTGASISTSSLSVGNHTITASVTDHGGLSSENHVTIKINELDVESPTGKFLTPASNGTLIKPRVLLAAEANDSHSGVKSVAFSAYFDGSWHLLEIDEDRSDGWRYTWPTYNISDQTGIMLKVVIMDNAGNLSQEIIVTDLTLRSTQSFGPGYEARSSSQGDENSFLNSEEGSISNTTTIGSAQFLRLENHTPMRLRNPRTYLN